MSVRFIKTLEVSFSLGRRFNRNSRSLVSIFLIASITNLGFMSLAFAAPDVTIGVVALKAVVEKSGAVSLKPAKEFDVGEVITYRIDYANRGDEPATGVIIENPIPKDTLFVTGSASGSNARVELSSDGGMQYVAASELESQQRIEQLTHVRWTVARINPGASGSVTYQVKVK